MKYIKQRRLPWIPDLLMLAVKVQMICFRVFADTETGVCYVIHTDVAHNSESMSVLLDETGSPMIDLSAITYVD